MESAKFKKAAKGRYWKALILSIVVHGLIISYVVTDSEIEYKEYIPEFVKDWFGEEPQVEPEPEERA